MAAIRARLTFANVMSVTAVFIALGGSALAINKIKANSVGSKQLKSQAVKNADLADNAVTSPKVANGSLLGEDFKAGSLPAGAQGVPGPQGPQGPQGPTGTVDTSSFYDKAASDARFLGTGATASNSSALGSVPAAAFPQAVHDDDVTPSGGSAKLGFARVELPSPGLPVTILNVGGIGLIEAECEFPPEVSLTYRNTQGSTEEVRVQHFPQSGAPAFGPHFTVPGGTAYPQASTTTTTRSIFFVGSGSTANPPARIAVFDVFSAPARAGATDTTCLIQVQSQSFTN
jgi:hypothetical protein